MQPTDPVTAIAQMYKDANRLVPYATFLKCFHKLTKDPATVEPKDPTDELRAVFRAVCMALDLGIQDTLERGEQRQKEFYEHVYPVWKQSMAEDEFEQYDRILDGTLRKARQRERREKQKQAAEEAFMEGVEVKGTEEQQTDLAKTSAAEDFGRSDRAEADTVLILPSIAALLSCVREDRLPIRYTTREEKVFFAVYRSSGQDISVKLVKTGASCHMVLTCPKGAKGASGLAQRLRDFVAARDYEALDSYSYVRKAPEGTFKVMVGTRSANVALTRAEPFDPDSFCDSLTALDELLCGLMEELQEPE